MNKCISYERHIFHSLSKKLILHWYSSILEVKNKGNKKYHNCHLSDVDRSLHNPHRIHEIDSFLIFLFFELTMEYYILLNMKKGGIVEREELNKDKERIWEYVQLRIYCMNSQYPILIPVMVVFTLIPIVQCEWRIRDCDWEKQNRLLFEQS